MQPILSWVVMALSVWRWQVAGFSSECHAQIAQPLAWMQSSQHAAADDDGVLEISASPCPVLINIGPHWAGLYGGGGEGAGGGGIGGSPGH